MSAPIALLSAPIALAQRTASLDRGHDTVAKNDATIVIDIAFGNASRSLPPIDLLWFSPARQHMERAAREAAQFKHMPSNFIAAAALAVRWSGNLRRM